MTLFPTKTNHINPPTRFPLAQCVYVCVCSIYIRIMTVAAAVAAVAAVASRQWCEDNDVWVSLNMRADKLIQTIYSHFCKSVDANYSMTQLDSHIRATIRRSAAEPVKGVRVHRNWDHANVCLFAQQL